MFCQHSKEFNCVALFKKNNYCNYFYYNDSKISRTVSSLITRQLREFGQEKSRPETFNFYVSDLNDNFKFLSHV